MESDGLKSIPLGELMEMRKNGKEIRRGDHHSFSGGRSNKVRRADKNAPQELSSKRPHKKQEEDVTKRVIRDPRFDGLSGKLNIDLYRKSYKFIEAKQEEEIKELKTEMYREEDLKKRGRIQSKMTRTIQLKIDRDRDYKRMERKREYMKTENEAVSKGKKPYFPKKREIRENELKDRFEGLRKKGRLNKYMEKKRRRNTERDVFNMPSVRHHDD